MDLAQHIRISGTFVIFQGVYGDGVRNTIDYIEPLVSSSLRQQFRLDDDDDDDETVNDTNRNNDNERDLTISSATTSSRGIVTPPPSCPNHILSTVTAAAAAAASVETETPTQVSHHTTTPIPESYVPPTKVAKTSTLEETIIAISATTIHSEFPSSSLEQSEVISSDGDMDDATNEVVTQDQQDHHTQQQQQHNAAVATEEGDHQLAQIWETECRTIELYHRKEWYENARSQTTTTTVYSSNSQTEKEQYSNILHPQHCLSFTGQEMENDDDVHGRADQIQNDNNSDGNSNASHHIHPSIPWWMSPETGGVAVLDQIPSPPIRIPPPPSIFGVSSSNIMLQLPSPPIQRIGSLAPGTIVVATALITLSRHGHDPDVPGWTPLAIPPLHRDDDDTDDTIDDSDHCRDPLPHETTKVHLPGRLGWIQLLKIISPMTGYCVLSIDGYSFAGPGLPHHYIPGGRRPRNVDPPPPNSLHHHSNPHSALLDGWYWRVMCIEGAYVRNGIDLTAHHVATIPYGSLVRVLRKSINAMGLSRLQIEAMYYSSTLNGNNNDNDRPQYITGWISEFLNPLSGQRGPIVLPLPFPVPALYEVSLPEGAVIRSDVELSSPIIGHAPFGTVVSVIGCTYTEQPKDRCIARFRLAGNGGYMNVHLNLPSPHDSPVVQFVGMDDEFNPHDPKAFHCRSVQNNIANSTQQHPHEPSSVAPCIYTDPSHLTMVGQNNPMTQQQRRVIERMRAEAAQDRHDDDDDDDHHHDDDDDDLLVAVSESPPNPTTTTTTTHRTTTLSAARRDHHARNYLCVICLCEERTATIIHGETGHIVCCLLCARILQARNDLCPVCRCPIDSVIQHFWA